MSAEKANCASCGREIRQLTADKTGGVRKSGLPLNGTASAAEDVLRVCLDAEKVGALQIAKCMQPFGDEEALRVAHLIFARVEGSKAETICDFMIKNTPPVSDSRWTPNLDGIVYLDRDEEDKIFGDLERGWDLFRKRFPSSRGIVEFSRVGFDAETGQALVGVGTQVHWLMGYGRYILLHRNNDAWKIHAEQGAWWS